MHKRAGSMTVRGIAASVLSTLALAASAGQPPCDNKTPDSTSSVACGSLALQNNAGIYNSAFGANALALNASGGSNAAFGYAALEQNTTGSGNVAVGPAAMEMNTTGAANTGVGGGALSLNTTGTFNTAVGSSALSQGRTSYGNTAVGAGAGQMSHSDSYNVAVGLFALQLDSSPDGSAGSNTAVGAAAMRSIAGTQNTAVGANALGSGYVVPTTHASFNTSVGANSMAANTTGTSNVALGTQALAGNTTASQNTGVGTQALAKNAAGTRNVALGYQAGYYAQGSNNVFVSNVGTGSDNGTIRIGDPAVHTAAYLAGVFKTNITGGANVVVSASGQLGVVSSSRRYKEAIEPMSEHGTEIYALRPVTFRYRQADDSGQTPVQYGLIAEEVADVFPELVVYNDAGEPETVRYQALTPILLNEVQKLHAQLAETSSLKSAVAAQQAQLAQMTRQLADLAALNRELRLALIERESGEQRLARQ